MREDTDDVSCSAIPLHEVEAAGTPASLAFDFRNAMRNLAAGVSVVTVGTGKKASGFTATSVVSLSVEVPTILVSLNRKSASWPLVKDSGSFAVNILSPVHVDIAETFAGRRGLEGHERYNDPRWLHVEGRVPRLLDALATIECDLDEAIERHSHVVLIGRVANATFRDAKHPLIYWQGDYNHLCDRNDKAPLRIDL